MLHSLLGAASACLCQFTACMFLTWASNGQTSAPTYGQNGLLATFTCQGFNCGSASFLALPDKRTSPGACWCASTSNKTECRSPLHIIQQAANVGCHPKPSVHDCWNGGKDRKVTKPRVFGRARTQVASVDPPSAVGSPNISGHKGLDTALQTSLYGCGPESGPKARQAKTQVYWDWCQGGLYHSL